MLANTVDRFTTEFNPHPPWNRNTAHIQIILYRHDKITCKKAVSNLEKLTKYSNIRHIQSTDPELHMFCSVSDRP